MIQISRDEFRAALADKVSPEKLDSFSGAEFYFQNGNDYLSLTTRVKYNMLWVDGIYAKGLDSLRELVNTAKAAEFDFIGFATTEDNRAVNALAKYTKAQIMMRKNGRIEYCAKLKAR